MVKSFNEYLAEGIVKRVSLDKERAKSLIKDSERKMKVLERQLKVLGIDKETSNEYVLICYDALMLLVRAKMLLGGYNASGFKAHEAEVSYMGVLGFNEKDVQFADQMRFFRNGMLYYGTILDEIYAKKAIDFTKRVYPKLKKLIKCH